MSTIYRDDAKFLQTLEVVKARQKTSIDGEQATDEGAIVEDELESLKPAGRPAEMERWNVEDLKAYRDRLSAEIGKIEEILSGKDSVKSEADGLFKK